MRLLLMCWPDVYALAPRTGFLIKALDVSDPPAAISALLEVPAQAVLGSDVAHVGVVEPDLLHGRKAHGPVRPPVPVSTMVGEADVVAARVVLMDGRGRKPQREKCITKARQGKGGIAIGWKG